MRYIITVQTDVFVDASDELEATTRAHAMLLGLEGVGVTRIVRIHELQGVG